MAKWLVTGGAGFIGSHLVDHLLVRGDDVRVLDVLLHGNKLSKKAANDVELLIGDVRDRDMVFNAVDGCDGVFHLAANIGVDFVASNEFDTMEVEAVGTSNVLKAMMRHGVGAIVYASTSAVYGTENIDKAVKEFIPVSPVSSYAIAKRFNEIYLNKANQEFDITSSSVRLFNVYGPRQDSRMVVPRFFQQAIGNEPITVFGNGSQTRDFTYVSEVVECLGKLAALESGAHIVNIARGSEMSVRDLAFDIAGLVGSDSRVRFTEPPVGRQSFEVARRCGASDLLFELIGTRPNMDISEGLRLCYKSVLSSI